MHSLAALQKIERERSVAADGKINPMTPVEARRLQIYEDNVII
jgi:hypothetical protein